MKTIQDLIAHITSECSKIDREERFNQMLDECYSFEKVGGPFEHMSPSRVLLEVDPIAHRCGVNDYMNGEDTTEVDGDDYETREVEAARESFVAEMNTELSGLQAELESEEGEEDPDVSEVGRITREIDELEKFIAECEKHAF